MQGKKKLCECTADFLFLIKKKFYSFQFITRRSKHFLIFSKKDFKNRNKDKF